MLFRSPAGEMDSIRVYELSPSSSSSASSSSSSTSVSAGTSGEKTQPAKKQKGNVTFLSSLDSPKIDAAPSNDVDYDLIPFFVSPVSEQSPKNRNKVLTLLDTGSLAGNFIASRILKMFSLEHRTFKNPFKLCRVCSGLNNNCCDISDTIDLTLSYFCPDLNKKNSFQISAFVLKDTPLDLIIGRKTIQDLNLFSIFPGQITSKTSSS